MLSCSTASGRVRMSNIPQTLEVIHIGLRSFADSIQAAGGSVLHVDWRPPAGGNVTVGGALGRLINNEHIETANRTAFEAFLSARPMLVDIRPAKELIPDLAKRLILHAGPPIGWERM